MVKIFNIEVTEKDNMLTALSKGMTEGALNGAVTLLGIAGVVYTLGKAIKEHEEETKKIEGEMLDIVDDLNGIFEKYEKVEEEV